MREVEKFPHGILTSLVQSVTGVAPRCDAIPLFLKITFEVMFPYKIWQGVREVNICMY